MSVSSFLSLTLASLAEVSFMYFLVPLFSKKLDKLPIEEIALRTNFSIHTDNQITGIPIAIGTVIEFFYDVKLREMYPKATVIRYQPI